MLKPAPFSSRVQEEEPRKPVLSALHLWRVTPSKESLHKIIQPAKGQAPIILRACRLSRRKVIFEMPLRSSVATLWELCETSLWLGWQRNRWAIS